MDNLVKKYAWMPYPVGMKVVCFNENPQGEVGYIIKVDHESMIDGWGWSYVFGNFHFNENKEVFGSTAWIDHDYFMPVEEPSEEIFKLLVAAKAFNDEDDYCEDDKEIED